MSNTARPKSAGEKITADEINRDLPILATAGEDIVVSSTPQAVYVKDADGECYKTNASTNTETIRNFVGFARTTGSNGNTFALQHNGIVAGFTGLDAGKKYYLTNSVGAIGTTPGTYKKLVAIAISTTEIKLVDTGLLQIAQTITGIKTFTSIPLLPASDPTTDNQAVRKSYVDLAEFGDKKDGNVTISTSVTLTEDKNYKKLTIASGGILNMDGYRVYAEEIDLQVGGEINLDGGDASGKTKGAQAHSNGTLFASADGETGANNPPTYGNGIDGADGDDFTSGIGSTGASGGDGGQDGNDSYIPGSGGDAGSVTAPNVVLDAVKKMLDFVDFDNTGIMQIYRGSAGSGSGASGSGGHANSVGGYGGGSGASGGTVYLFIGKITINGIININGGDDGNRENGHFGDNEASGAGGGGGAGSGGVLILYTRELNGSGTININGRDGGDGGDGANNSYENGNGSDGGDGGNGGNGGVFYKIFDVDNSSLTVNVSAGSGGAAGSAGTGGSSGNPGSVGSAGSSGSVGTINSIEI